MALDALPQPLLDRVHPGRQPGARRRRAPAVTGGGTMVRFTWCRLVTASLRAGRPPGAEWIAMIPPASTSVPDPLEPGPTIIAASPSGAGSA